MEKAHRLLDRMSDASRTQLDRDLHRWGAQLLGSSLNTVCDTIDGGRTPNGTQTQRAERLHAWMLRNGLTSPLRTDEPTARSPEPDNMAPIARWDDRPAPAPAGFDRVPVDGDEDEPIEAVLARGEAAFRERARRAAASRGPRQIRMPPGPYAIAHFGDDHLDDDGCDLPSYRAAIRIVAATPYFFGGAVGDLLNNWPTGGRLAELNAHQHTTTDDGWRLARWSMQSVRWVYRVLGNHDLWTRGGTILRLLAEGCQIGLMEPDELRLELLSPGHDPLRIHVRHDFKGRSMWNPAHGPMRASKLDTWGDVFIAGHIHEWVAHAEEGVDHRIRWSLRARGFKRFDDHASSLQFSDQQYGQVVSTVVDPGHVHPFERVRVYLDVQEAAEALGWLRRRRGFTP